MIQIKGFVIQKNASNICKLYKYIYDLGNLLDLKHLFSWD
jgi:hypothetical protein